MNQVTKNITTSCALGLLIYCNPLAQSAADDNRGQIIVSVSGVPSDEGTVNCGLFPSEKGFPMDPTAATQVRIDATRGEVECRFDMLTAGRYAIAVSHDGNENGETDTNFFGIPKEAWGVSNNVRPLMRAPTFDEAVFSLQEGEALNIDIALD